MAHITTPGEFLTQGCQGCLLSAALIIAGIAYAIYHFFC